MRQRICLGCEFKCIIHELIFMPPLLEYGCEFKCIIQLNHARAGEIVYCESSSFGLTRAKII